MTKRPLKRLSYKPALKPEDLDAALAKLRQDMSEAAAQLASDTAPLDKEEDLEERQALLDAPDLSDRAEAALRELLEEETLALIETEGPNGIAAHELEHELQKKALVGLKREVLAGLASQRGLVPAGKLDDLAQQVAASFGWEEQEIARLVLDYAEDPRVTEGGPVTRVFILEDPVDLAFTTDRLSYVDGRYYRTDIAKWFTFKRFRRTDSVLRVEGSLQTYKAGVNPLDEEKLTSDRAEFDAQLELREGSSIAFVHHAANATVARSVMSAFKVAALAGHTKHVPNAGTGAAIRPLSLHPSTEWLLHVITHRLRGHLFRDRNPVLARFRFTREEARTGEGGESSRKASLRAVRFEGRNLMASPAACGLMWTEGRPLVDITLMVSSTKSETDSTIRGSLPIRIALERDHVLVSTGLASDVSLVNEVHRTVVAQVALSIENAVSDQDRAQIEATIRAQAESPDPDADDTLLGDDLGPDLHAT